MSGFRLEVRQLKLPVRATLAASHDESPDHFRLLTVVRLESTDGHVGWGECSALNRVGYSSESSDTAFDLLSGDNRLDLDEAGTALAGEAPMAVAALEMAEFDLRLRANGVPLAEYLGVERSHVAAGAAVPLGAVEEVVRISRDLFHDGFGRLKLKIVPQNRTGVAPAAFVAAVREACDGVEVHVDGNGSFDRSTIGEIHDVVDAGAAIVEQPFAVNDISPSAELVSAGVAVLADEGATNAVAIKRLVAIGACAGVVIKSSRLGGLYEAFELMSWCDSEGIAVAAGGMQESGLGRHALAVTAAHDAASIIGDVGPARRWLAEDPWPDIKLTAGNIEVPNEPGVAPLPDLGVLDRHTVRMSHREFTP